MEAPVQKNILYTLFLFILTISSCGWDLSASDNPADTSTDYKEDMRKFVEGISAYAKGIDSTFIIIPQNGHQLITVDGETTGDKVTAYLGAIDGVGREDLFYGYDSDDMATATAITDDIVVYLDIAENNGVEALVTDYCSTESNMDDSYTKNEADGYISFAADYRDLNNIPMYPATLHNVHTGNVTTLAEAKNFLYLLDPSSYTTSTEFVEALSATNYDVLIIDSYFDSTALAASEVASLKTKANGGSRLVISYMSIGEAENYRYYWQSSWITNSPTWLAAENPDWLGNYKVRYWQTAWQDIIFGEDNSYVKKILDAGFDGVYLDIIDAFEYFEGL
jgi:cysteinyl-tRNA synthetase